jgi:hypothetical protein
MRKLLAVVAAASLLFAACGGDEGGGGNEGGNPKEVLQNAFDELSGGGNTVVMSLNSDPASLAALSEGSITEDTAAKILDSSLTISGSEPTDDPLDAEFAMAANIAGSTDVEIRFVDGTLYLRVDIDSLLDLAGPEAKAQAGPQIDAFVQQAAAQGLDWVEAGANGEWLAFTGFRDLLEQFGGLAASPSADQQAIVDNLAREIVDKATVTSEGTDDVGEHLVASAEVKDLYDALVGLTEEFGQGVPAPTVPEGEIPDGEVELDLWVADGQLVQLEVDFLQIAELADEPTPEGVDSFGLRMEFSDFEAGVEVPGDATEVDLTQLLQTFAGGALGGGTGSTGSGGSSTDAFCEQLKTQPKEVQKQFAAQCPNL